MNCWWILLLLGCCGNGFGLGGNNSCNNSGNNCGNNGNNGCGCSRPWGTLGSFGNGNFGNGNCRMSACDCDDNRNVNADSCGCDQGCGCDQNCENSAGDQGCGGSFPSFS